MAQDLRTARWVNGLAALLSPLVQALIDRFGFGVVVVIGRRIWANDRVLRTFGRPRRFASTVDGWFTELYGERAQEVRQMYEGHRADNWPETAIVQVPRTDGGHRMVAFAATRWGPVEVWVPADVTASVRDTEHFRILFEHSTEPHLVFDGLGIVECNEAAVRFLRMRDKAEVLARHPATFSPERQPDGRSSREKSVEMDALARTHGFHRFEWVHLRGDGSEVTVEVSLTPVALPSGPGHLVVWHDLTERLEKEQALEAAARAAEEGLVARQSFLASMSHEIRTPMNGVLGLVDALLDDEALCEEHRAILETVRSSGRSLRQLLDDLLDFSKYEAGDLQLETQPVRLRDVVGSAVELHRGRLEGGAVDLRAEFSPDLASAYLGDPVRLRQLVDNLVSNAVKFTTAGEVVVSARADSKGQVVLTVEDTGIGMSNAQQARIFEPFKQADAGTTRRFGGTGLGLAIVDRLVRAMGGRIDVDSAPGRGSTFRITLPLPVAPDEGDEARPAGSSSDLDATTELSVLVAEDNRVNQMVLKKALDRYPGVRARFVEDGSQAVEAVAACSPDLVIMDVHMPEMDGLAATRRLRERGHRGLVVALTASCLESELRACLEAGMNEVLRKPLERAELDRVLRRCREGATGRALG